MTRFIGVLRFDSITTFEEFQKIVMGLLETNLELTIEKDPQGDNIYPKYAAWQLIIKSRESTPKVKNNA